MSAKLILGSMTFFGMGFLAPRNVLLTKVELISAKLILGSMTFLGLALLPIETL